MSKPPYSRGTDSAARKWHWCAVTSICLCWCWSSRQHRQTVFVTRQTTIELQYYQLTLLFRFVHGSSLFSKMALQPGYQIGKTRESETLDRLFMHTTVRFGHVAPRAKKNDVQLVTMLPPDSYDIVMCDLALYSLATCFAAKIAVSYIV